MAEKNLDESIKSLELFFNNFGENDIYTQILLEELFKILLNHDNNN